MKSSSSVVFKDTQAHFHTLHWFWEDAISLCWNPTLHTQGLNQLLGNWAPSTMPCIAHTSRSLLKGSDTAQPRILALQHLTQPAPGTVEFLQGLGIISMPKSLWPQGTSGQEASLRERAEHRHLTWIHCNSFHSPAPKDQVSTSCWVFWSCSRNLDLHFPHASQMPKSLGCPTPGCLSLSAGQRQLCWTKQASLTPGPPAMPCWTAHLGFTFALFSPLNITWLES